MNRPKQMTVCPHCRTPFRYGLVICPHCRKEVKKTNPFPARPSIRTRPSPLIVRVIFWRIFFYGFAFIVAGALGWGWYFASHLLPNNAQVSALAPSPARPTKAAITQAPPTPPVYSFCPKVSLRVRSGPGTNYDMLDGLTVGECYQIQARNPEGTWLYLGQGGWVSADPSLIVTSHPLDLIPIYTPQP